MKNNFQEFADRYYGMLQESLAEANTIHSLAQKIALARIAKNTKVSTVNNGDGTYTHTFEFFDKPVVINAPSDVGEPVYLK